VVAHATAVTGRPSGFIVSSLGNESGTAVANASAQFGTSGEARADAHASGLELRVLSATTSASVSVGSQPIVESNASVGDPFLKYRLQDLDAIALARGSPEPGDVESATQGTTQVAAAFSGDAIDLVLSLGQVGFTRSYQGEGELTTRQAAFEIAPDAFAVSVLQDVMLGFMNPGFLGEGFDSLRFQANLGDETVVDESFDELDEALAYFDDRVLDLGNFSISGGPRLQLVSPLQLVFDWSGFADNDGEDRFGLDFIVGVAPIPEPGTGLLLALGLTLLAAHGRRHSRACPRGP
jgi:hypothetical protein